MMYEALELASPNPGQSSKWEDLVITLVKADSADDLLSLLKDRPSERGWRLALLRPEALEEFLEKDGNEWKIKPDWEEKIVYVGEKNPSDSIKEDVLDRQYVHKAAAKGIFPLYNVLPPSNGEGGYSSEATLKKGGEPFFRAGGTQGRGHVCLVVVKQEIFDAIKQRKKDVVQEDPRLKDPRLKDPRLKDLRSIYVGDSQGAEDIRRAILEAVDNDVREWPILIVGESGTGKEVIARAIYISSQRKTNGAPFISLNCGAITPTIISSELFGHEKGAFADAKWKKIGAWEAAGRGYLFLDEVGEIPFDQQAVLLTALERGTIQRVGGAGRDIGVEARVIAATNRDILGSGQQIIRRDLLGRLKRGIVIQTIPLRSQPEVIPAMANHLWEKIKKRFEGADAITPLPKEITDELKRYLWPENVRDLDAALSALHRYQGYSERPLTVHDLRAVELKVPGMVRPRNVIVAPEGQLVRSELEQLDCLLSLSETLSNLNGSALSSATPDGDKVGLPSEIEDELSGAIRELDRSLDQHHLQRPETVIVVGELKGRIEALLKGPLRNEAKAVAFLKGMIVPKLGEVEAALQKERDQLGRGALSLQNTDQVKLTDDLVALTEALARHAHEVWRRQREAEGWKKGKTWDGEKKTNPDLVDYGELPDKEKDLSRKAALGTLKAIVALGYAIERPDIGGGNQ